MATLEEHITHRGPYIYYDVGEAGVLDFRKVFLYIFLTVGKTREVGRSINPDITWLCVHGRGVLVAVPRPFAQDILVILRAAGGEDASHAAKSHEYD